ncbi:ABC transporter permease [Clostridium beijerinckii]|uniref:Transport permease protein n=1 Tax=Clostridium beijerinckii TaxID=1520 RepID=A0AAW3W436_CLOBE|nr:ABC transporter permease [Clostridium beijerinckii]MBC2455742.1 ABC transporter permease [Clostridium beijerinckii]MBC2473219.1 ABC transporter permease [Clostridium beijerinckii]NOV62272.1 ABC-2 type transport system permease protein [Clostridium beijerinckii]NOV68231.1 ABC-2 type transport system permease protein [Clostridium beijerinckii]NOW30324.1 ABC-2 type transport system permease protein [Clostridium beijerinckii]
MEGLKELYNYREMLSNLVKKDLRTRYKGSVLGFLWTFVNPLLQLIVYTMVFSVIMRAGIDKYYIYLFVALVPWIFFATSITTSASSIIRNKDLIKKIYFPRLIIPMSVVNGAFMNMIFTMVVVFAALIFSEIGISKYVLLLPIILILEYLFALGLSFIVSALNVYFRDLEHILGIVTMAWMYGTPILYGIDMVPENLQSLFNLNPMTPIILAIRDILYYKKMPDLSHMGLILMWSIGFIIIGYFIFQKLQKGFVEEL